ncbi:MAG: substrate-binding domain-containing protein [Lachnospiraceae bacterium]|nr:substrate-binding domain-containing protein [bacterium]MDY5516420.1 substrate-binding domain-containing protein [Lachnospiraceae bacterium]
MTTLKEIADLAGVSRGTVDRVLNHRGSVNPKTAEKVMSIVQALNYQPNRAGTALAAQKKKNKIGVIVFGRSNPFFDEVMRGVRAKSDELQSYGITTIIRRVDFNVHAQLRAIDELVEEGMNGLVLAPYNDSAICERINELVASDIPVVTINTDIEGSNRMAYVGSDYFRGGCIAAGLFALSTSGDISLGIITGSSSVLCHTERIRGLERTLAESYPNIHVNGIVENHDDEIESYTATRQLLADHPETDALFFTAAGIYGGCKAVTESGLHPRIITFDEVPTTLELIKKGTVLATISQQPYKQGYRSLDILFEYLTSGILPENELQYVEHSILIRENLPTNV